MRAVSGVLALLLLLPGCRQLIHTVRIKQIAPEVVSAASEPGSWYAYLPDMAPGFCLITRHAVWWQDTQMGLGWWRARHSSPPYRVMMEARGDTFILHRRYVWDGMTWGRTELQDLFPTLLHDALYHALQNGAPVSRRQVDRLFLRLRRESDVFWPYGEYLSIRIAGGLYNAAGDKGGLMIEPLTPGEPPAALEADHPEPLAGEGE